MRLIKAIDIMFPGGQKSLLMIQTIPYIDTICRKLMNIGYELIFKGSNLANIVKYSENSMPHVFELLTIVATKVGISVPEVYVYNDPVMNAFTYG